MEEVVLRLEELLFPSIANIAVLSVDVNIEIVRVDEQGTMGGAVCPGCGSWSTGSIAPTYGSPPTYRVQDDASYSSYEFGGFGVGTPCAHVGRLAQRPGIEVICRDRTPFFAEGASAGAPQAVQVADRWHLWHNLSEAAERSVAQHRLCLHVLSPAAPQSVHEAVPAADPSASPWPRGHQFADRTRARHAAVQALLKAGHSRRSVQRQLGMTYRTVKQLADAAIPEELFTG
ncbi:hypothetical protein [Streptomyces sp. NBC_00893]|uniref:hypothetical protein n=1 Tax=Streptomyces sp. NBC_00893 TaxID=2975862 RepID=UPI002252A650|nr:hypothetical protein [Streptomyces sp. NBC_00893]MCX4851666.1 hypothetical protein [Streptomyces sp. NBC_00893]